MPPPFMCLCTLNQPFSFSLLQHCLSSFSFFLLFFVLCTNNIRESWKVHPLRSSWNSYNTIKTTLIRSIIMWYKTSTHFIVMTLSTIIHFRWLGRRAPRSSTLLPETTLSSSWKLAYCYHSIRTTTAGQESWRWGKSLCDKSEKGPSYKLVYL